MNHTEIQVDVDQPGRYSIQVFDITGRMVNELYSGPLNKGIHTYRWSQAPLVAPGQYYMRVSNLDDKTFQIVKMNKQ